MSVLGDLMRELVAAGVQGDALIAVVERFDEAAAESRRENLAEMIELVSRKMDERLPPYDAQEHRRALARARQERYAERKRQQASENVSVASARISDDDKETPPAPPKEISPIPPLKGGTFPTETEDQPEKPIQGLSEKPADEPTHTRSARRPTRPIPDGFPTEELIAEQAAKMRAEGFDIDIRLEAERFRNHAIANDRRQARWEGAWSNWVLKARGWAPRLPQPPTRQEPENPWPSRMLKWRRTGYWDSDWGPKPGREGFRGPPEQEQAA